MTSCLVVDAKQCRFLSFSQDLAGASNSIYVIHETHFVAWHTLWLSTKWNLGHAVRAKTWLSFAILRAANLCMHESRVKGLTRWSCVDLEDLNNTLFSRYFFSSCHKLSCHELCSFFTLTLYNFCMCTLPAHVGMLHDRWLCNELTVYILYAIYIVEDYKGTMFDK